MIDYGMPTLIELSDAEECAALAARLGLKFVELNMSFPRYQLECLDADRLRRLTDKYGIYFTVHLNESLDVTNVNPRIARVYTEDVLGTVELAKKIGIPSLNMHLLRGIYVTLPDRRTFVYAENEEFYLEGMRRFRDEVTQAIGDSGVGIRIENTDGYDLPFLVHAMDTLLESPAFSLTFDIGHDNAIGHIDEPLILEREGRLKHMHMHDGIGGKVHLALGDGNMDIPRFVRLAEKNGCRVVLETKTVAALEKSAAYINSLYNTDL